MIRLDVVVALERGIILAEADWIDSCSTAFYKEVLKYEKVSKERFFCSDEVVGASLSYRWEPFAVELLSSPSRFA